MLYITILILLFWIDDTIALMIGASLFFITLPAVIITIYSVITSIPMNNRHGRTLLYWGLFNVLLLFAYFMFRQSSQGCDAFIMAEHYEKNSWRINDFIKYINSVFDDKTSVQIEFEDEKLSSFHVSSPCDTFMYCFWDEDAEVKKDSLMKVVGLTHAEYDNIHRKLKELDCVGFQITKSHPNDIVTIYFRRWGLGMYSFLIFQRPMTQDEKDAITSDGEYIPYNEKVAFHFGGGGFGPQVFPSEEKRRFMNTHNAW